MRMSLLATRAPALGKGARGDIWKIPAQVAVIRIAEAADRRKMVAVMTT